MNEADRFQFRYVAVLFHSDSNFSVDDLQALTHDLCYAYQRCTRAVRVPAPVYYAELCCNRARSHLQHKSSAELLAPIVLSQFVVFIASFSVEVAVKEAEATSLDGLGGYLVDESLNRRCRVMDVIKAKGMYFM